MKKRVLAAFLSMAMVAGLATGCGTPGGGKSDGDSADGKVFRYAVNTLPTTLDRALVTMRSSMLLQRDLPVTQPVMLSRVLQRAGMSLKTDLLTHSTCVKMQNGVMESQSQLLTSSTAGRDWLILRQPAHMHSLVTA